MKTLRRWGGGGGRSRFMDRHAAKTFPVGYPIQSPLAAFFTLRDEHASQGQHEEVQSVGHGLRLRGSDTAVAAWFVDARPERAWWRRAHRNELSVLALLEESALDAAMPEWDELALTWEDLRVLPARWKSALSQGRGIYVIFDHDDGKRYVGSAYGKDNLLGRWLHYAAVGHGGNKYLRQRNPRSFSFSILQRVSPDMGADEIIRLEATWKTRLHTRHPDGLNDN